MNWFPQVGQGSATQFPFTRSRTARAIRNVLDSGEQIMLPDPAAGQVSWALSYKDLNETERAGLNSLFISSQGSFGSFGFADPLVNLIAWSEDLTRPDWQAGLLSVAGALNDPTGTQRAFSVSNPSAGDQQLTQTVSLPGEYVTSYSVWLRSAGTCQVTLQRDGAQTKAAVGPLWSMFFVSSAGPAGAESAAYSIVIPAGQTIQVWAPQVEVQPYPSQYKTATVASGIYPETYFAADELSIANTAPGLFSCEVKLLSRV